MGFNPANFELPMPFPSPVRSRQTDGRAEGLADGETDTAHPYGGRGHNKLIVPATRGRQ